MSDSNTLAALFLEQVKKRHHSKFLLDWYEDFFSKQTFPLRLDIETEHKDIFEICLNLFFSSQKVLLDLAYGRLKDDVAAEVVRSLNTYSVVDVILQDHVNDNDLSEKLSDLFNNALFYLTPPLDGESFVFSRALLNLISNFYIPRSMGLLVDRKACEPIQGIDPLTLLFAKKYFEDGMCTLEEFEEASTLCNVSEEDAERYYETISGVSRVLLDKALDRA